MRFERKHLDWFKEEWEKIGTSGYLRLARWSVLDFAMLKLSQWKRLQN